MRRTWTLVLNQYQRDNLLQLINVCGWPYPLGVEPFRAMNTGDWLGEIGLMLNDEDEWFGAGLDAERSGDPLVERRELPERIAARAQADDG